MLIVVEVDLQTMPGMLGVGREQTLEAMSPHMRGNPEEHGEHAQTLIGLEPGALVL